MKTILDKPTLDGYSNIQEIYDILNHELFAGKLFDCVITLQYRKSSRGHFHASQWKINDEENYNVDEINLNPVGYTDSKTLISTLLHEMCHLYQEHFGKSPPRKAYHNKEFAEIMKERGLQCSHNGQVDGKETGQKMTHYIIENGAYDTIFNKYNWQINLERQWNRNPKKPSKNSKVKFTCPDCECNAWGKETLNIHCADCDVKMNPTE